MVIQFIAGRKFATPFVVHDDHSPNFSSLNDCLRFTAVFRSLPDSFHEKNIDGSLIVIVAALNKAIGLKEELHSVLGGLLPEKFVSYSFWEQNSGKQKTELGQEAEKVQSNDARGIYRTLRWPHYFGATPKMSKPSVRVLSANSAVFLF